MNVTAADQGTGEAASTQITLSSGLAEQEIEKIIQQDVAGRVATAVAAQDAAGDQLQPITIAGDEPGSPTPMVAADADSPFGDGSDDLSTGREDALDLDGLDVDEDELDLVDDDELMQLTQEADGEIPADGITLDAPAEADEDDGFFDTSGEDLGGPEIELTDEEK